MKISDILKTKSTISFEIFPPKNKDGDIKMYPVKWTVK